MKHMIMAAMMVLGTNAMAAEMIYDCNSSSDPDFINLSIYKDGKKLYAVIEEFYGDGDDFDNDVIALEELDNGNADATVFAQIPGKYPKAGKLQKKATKQTQGATIRIATTKDGESSI